MLFQYSAETEFRQAVEVITGREVIAVISGIDTRSDIASELFLLEPVVDSWPSSAHRPPVWSAHS